MTSRKTLAHSLFQKTNQTRPIEDFFFDDSKYAVHSFVTDDYAKAAQTWKNLKIIDDADYNVQIVRKAIKYCCTVWVYDYIDLIKSVIPS
jgi:hypothetical protein